MSLRLRAKGRSLSRWARRLLPLATALLAGCQEVPTEAVRFIELQIEAPATTLDVGSTLNLGVSAVSSGGARLELVGLNWRSSDPVVAAIEDGRVAGLLPGRTFIHAYIGGMSDSLLVTVRPAPDSGARSAVHAPTGCWGSGSGAPLGPPTMC